MKDNETKARLDSGYICSQVMNPDYSTHPRPQKHHIFMIKQAVYNSYHISNIFLVMQVIHTLKYHIYRKHTILTH